MSHSPRSLALLTVALAAAAGSSVLATVVLSGTVLDSDGAPAETYLLAASPGTPFAPGASAAWARLEQGTSDVETGYRLEVPAGGGETLVLAAKYGVGPHYFVLEQIEVPVPDLTVMAPDPDIDPEIHVERDLALPDFDPDQLSLRFRVFDGGVELDYATKVYWITVMSTGLPSGGRAAQLPGTGWLQHGNRLHDLPDGQYTARCVLEDPQNPSVPREQVITLTLPISGDPLADPVDIHF